MQRLPLRRRLRRLRWLRRMWRLRRWLDRDRSALGSLHRLLCIVGPLSLVLVAAHPDCASTSHDFMGRVRDRTRPNLLLRYNVRCAHLDGLPVASERVPF
jgi:hypothetical protein